MASISTLSLRNYNAINFLESVAGTNSVNNLYLTIGRQVPWLNEPTQTLQLIQQPNLNNFGITLYLPKKLPLITWHWLSQITHGPIIRSIRHIQTPTRACLQNPFI